MNRIGSRPGIRYDSDRVTGSGTGPPGGGGQGIPSIFTDTMLEQAFKNIDDVLWKEAGCTTELDYTEQTSWLLFLKYLQGLEESRATEQSWGAIHTASFSMPPTAGKAGPPPKAPMASSITTPPSPAPT